jgi:hypothetical protein
MKYEREIGKALKETGLTAETVRSARAAGGNKLLEIFVRALKRHLHGEAIGDALKQFDSQEKPTVCAEGTSSGDSRIDYALKEVGMTLEEAKRLVVAYFNTNHLPETERNKYLHFARIVRHRMSAEMAQEIFIAWSQGNATVVKTAGWIRANCKFAD